MQELVKNFSTGVNTVIGAVKYFTAGVYTKNVTQKGAVKLFTIKKWFKIKGFSDFCHVTCEIIHCRGKMPFKGGSEIFHYRGRVIF